MIYGFINLKKARLDYQQTFTTESAIKNSIDY